jgi:non-heme chloroperoxidase
MGTVTTKDGGQTFYKDWGSGPSIVFSHGWPLNADDWDAQMMFFASRGCRCLAHDRRGHGRMVYKGLPHGMATTQRDVINADTAGLFQSVSHPRCRVVSTGIV